METIIYITLAIIFAGLSIFHISYRRKEQKFLGDPELVDKMIFQNINRLTDNMTARQALLIELGLHRKQQYLELHQSGATVWKIWTTIRRDAIDFLKDWNEKSTS